MPKSKEPSFEDQLKRLEGIVEQLETKEAPLDASLGLFEEGIKLARACQQTLEDAKKKVQILIKESGQLKPFPESEASLDEAND
jgi:exodeoxyribonuclease VII small subunit